MIRQDGNGNQNNGRSTQRNSSRIPIVSDVLDLLGGGGQPEMQTTTQQNLPSWAIPFAQQGLNLANYYTMNPNYRPSTLDRDYSGIRGYNAQGQPNSQVGSFGLNPLSIQPSPTSVTPAPPEPPQRNPYTGKLNAQKMSQFHHGDPDGDGTFDTPLTFRPGQGFFLPDGSPYNSTVVGSGDQITQYYGDPDGDGTFDMPIERGPDGFYQSMPVQNQPEPGAGITGNLFGGGMFGGVSGRAVQNQPNNPRPGTGLIENPNSPGFVDDRNNLSERPGGRSASRSAADPLNPGSAATETGAYTNPFPGGADTFNINPGAGQVNAGDNANTPGAWSAEDVRKAQAGQGKLTVADGFVPFENTTTSSGTSSETSFDPSQMTPFQAYDRQRFAAPSDRTVQGETLLANRVNGLNPFAEAQAAARGASNYQSQFAPAALNLTGPKANSYNNVNQGLLAEQYGNANQGLTPAQNYSRAFQENLAQFQDPFTSQVVNQTIKDLDRARRITNNDISGNAARAGAFGGSREALMRTENNRNFADRTAAAVGQLRSQGFQQAAERAQQEQLQRLGLTASDIQNLRGYQSAGNLQGQNITAQDVRDVRGLQSQGALTAQGLGAQSDRDAMGFQNQLQMQGNQLGVEQARLAEQFRQGAGALNLQGAGALGNLAQMQTADERQRIADLLAAGGAGDARNQQDLDFIFNEFNRELAYPGQQIDLRNAAISPATGSVVTTTQPRYSSGGLPQAAGAGLATYGMLAGIPAAAPYALPAALAMGLLNY